MDETDDERPEAQVSASGVCTWTGLDADVEWPSLSALAEQYWADTEFRRTKEVYGPTHEFVASMTMTGDALAVDVIQALVDTAASEPELDFVGAGPLEDLLSHSGHGLKFLDDIERRARQQPRFRVALAGVWLGSDTPEALRTRLAAFGTTVIEQTRKKKRRK